MTHIVSAFEEVVGQTRRISRVVGPFSPSDIDV
jgi:hypothetical protein